MPTLKPHLALLRGVNVGGNKQVRMSDLRKWMEALGFTGAQTLLQSGNIVFSAEEENCSDLERRLEMEARKQLGLTSDFHVRTLAEWEEIILGNPFCEQARSDPSHLVAFVLKNSVTPSLARTLQAAIQGREIVRVKGRTAYVYYPDGIGTSRLTAAVIDRHLQTRGTARNWNTVLKLGSLARGE
jgi:uncharacterized protein (DUF1697 family)